MTALLEQVRGRSWFYEFDLPDGSHTTSYLPAGVEQVHTTRLAMLDAGLASRYGTDLSALDAVDLACHQGYFALHLARRGARAVLGVDARAEHLADAKLMLGVQGFGERLATRQLDLEEARAEDIGSHDITLMLGLLYHLENPVRALRLARAVTRKTLFIETQVVPHLSGLIDWGAEAFQRPMVGTFGIVDETEETHAPEASARGICLAPSIEALAWLLKRVGFARVERLPTPAGGYEQFQRDKRVMFAADV